MKILLHVCCGVCLAGVLPRLREEDADVLAFFYNPNIHPLLEFRRRLKAVYVLRESERFDLIAHEEYGLMEFLNEARWKTAERCASCYRMRLATAAREAQRQHCDAFATTMTISTHQNHALLRTAGEACAESAGVPFLYRDYRSEIGAAHEIAKRKGLYRQAYCGCIFSEYERYRDTTKHLYRGTAANGN